MSHLYGSTCKRKQSPLVPCETCRFRGGGRGREVRPHATPQEVGAAVDMYFDGLSYRRTAENVHEYFGRATTPMTVFRWVQQQTKKADEAVKDWKVDTGPEWVADEIAVKLGGQQYWIFNVMDSISRFVLAAYFSKERTTWAAAAALAMARERSNNAPNEIKTDGLGS